MKKCHDKLTIGDLVFINRLSSMYYPTHPGGPNTPDQATTWLGHVGPRNMCIILHLQEWKGLQNDYHHLIALVLTSSHMLGFTSIETYKKNSESQKIENLIKSNWVHV